MKENDTLSGLEIAVIGMAGRFPGARNINEYWENIKNGIESNYFFSEEELDKAGVSPSLYTRPDFVKSTGGILEGMDLFDANFFGYTPTEAELLDPQVRLFHECSWEALEDAGYDPGAYEGLIGLFAGAEDNIDWREKVFLSNTEPGSQYSSMLLSCKDFVSARVSYKLNLKGPVYSLVTGCSTALTSIHLACRSLLGGECDMAMAGGVYVFIPPLQGGYLYQEGRLLSHDGHLRAFDARASGTVFSSGIGVVVLKTLEDARMDNDHIYAIVKGSAVNSDGNRKVNFTAPSVKGQAKVIKAAYQAADVDPETIGYLETHGTGTRLGDPIEINALKQAFNTTPGWKCPIGSVKTNIGHLDVAAGAASFIKTVLILKHKLIPPSLNFETPNPKLELDKSPFYVNTQLQELQSNGAPRRAAVSSFGFGGTNAHAVLEEAPAVSKSVNQEVSESGGQLVNGQPTDSRGGSLCPPLKSRDNQLILLSAKTKTALDKMTQNLVNFLKENRVNPDNPVNPGQNPGLTLANVAYTLQTGRQPSQYRKICVGSNVEEVIHTLSSSPEGQAGEDPPVIFMFSGQGSQYVNMGLEIYHSEPIFREQMDHGFDILKSLTGKDFKEIFYPSGDIAGAEEEMKDFRNIGPIKLIFEYSLAKLLMDWGIRPHALLGHSFGEYTAACLAGVFSIEEALKLALIRGELILRTPPGGMMSVPLPEDQLNQYLQSHPDIYLTAVNSSSLCFVSGLPEPLDRLEKELEQTGLECIRINVPCAGHSPMMKSITGEFAGRVREIKLHDPTIPFISGLTGNWVSPGQLSDPSYWATHLEQPVRFCQGLEKLLNEPGCIFLQVGADKGLPLFVKQHRDLKPGTPVLNLVRHKKDNTADMYFLLNQLGTLWVEGVNIDWRNFHARQQRQRIPLPTYPFEGERYWIDLDRNAIFSNFFSRGPLVKRENVSDWLYTSSWKRCPLVQESTGPPHESPTLIFSDACQLGSRLAGKLEEKGREVIMVKPGEKFEQESQQVYQINPTQGGDYDRLFKTLNTKKKMPGLMIHLWNVTGDKAPDLTSTSLETTLDLGFYSLIHIVQSMGRLGIHDEVHLEVVTDNMQPVMDEKVLYPAKATILGAVGVIPQEYPNISCFALDIILPEPGSPGEKQLLQQLVDTFTRESPDIVPRVRAFRSNRYWTPVFESIPLEKTPLISSRLKEGGVYLLTGGLGGIGFVLAQYLVKTVNARLILTGRSQLPAKDQWRQWLDTHQQEDRVSQRIKKVMDLEKSGAEVLVFSADSADQKQVQEVITRAVKHFGQINGIIHTAGLVDFHGVIQNRTREMTENILAPKVRGTMILDMLTRDMPLDFFIICSSIASLFPGFGEVGYAAANIFIDAFAHYKNLTGTTFTAAVNWDTWQEVGGAVEAARKQREAGKTSYIQLKDGILNTEGIEAFTLILQNSNPQVVVSTKDLHLLLQQRLTKTPEQDQTELEEAGEKVAQRDLRPRPQLKTPYVAPENPTQEILAKIWQEYFGIDQVGIRDDFFELGGDSLMATVMAARIHKRINTRVPLIEIFEGPTIEELSIYIKSLAKEEFKSIPLAEKKEYYPLSPAQKRLFILQQLDPGITSYNSPDFFILEGKLDKEKLNNCLRKMIQRHESLRTTFEMIEGTAVQRIVAHIDFEVDYYSSSEEEAVSIVKDFMRPFDLARAPLLRVGLIKFQEEMHIFMFDMHHIITDGTSLEIFANEFMALYSHRQLPPLPVQYRDFSQWQNQLLRTEEIKKQEQYWLNEFKGEIPLLDLPTDYPRPEVQSFAGRKFHLRLSPEYTRGLNQLSREQDVTLYMTTLAVLKVFLSRLSGQETIIMGTSSAGRQHEDIQYIIGMFVNTLVLKSFPFNDKTFKQFLQELKQKSLASLENQDYPFENLVEKLNLTRDMSRNPLFDVMFSFQNYEAPPLEAQPSPSSSIQEAAPQLRNRAYSFEDLTSRFDLTFFVEENADALSFNFEYCTKLFKQETIERFGNYLVNIISIILENPGVRLGNIEIISDEEKQRVLYDFNRTDVKYPHQMTIHQLFTNQVERTPHQIGLVGSGQWTDGEVTVKPNINLSYSHLNEETDRLAHLLIEKGVQSDTIAAIMMDRSIEVIVGILGILKSGCAYLPVDPQFPKDRIDYMLADSKAQFLLKGPGIQVSALEPSASTSTSQVSPANLAYIIYTSGSTGKPKGVLVDHHSAINILVALQKEYPLGKKDTYLFKTSYLFDVSVTELFGWFLDSGRLAVLEKGDEKNPQGILAAIPRYCVTHINFVPSMFNVFIEGLSANDIDKLSGLKYIFLAGEALSPQLVRKFRSLGTDIPLENIYGPTEATIYSSNYPLSHWRDRGSIPIGKSMQNVKLYILDKGYIIQPIGIAGELCIGGVGVARGYLNNPELTAEKFDQDLWDYLDYHDKKNNQNLLRGGLNQWVSGSVGQLADSQAQIGNPLTMMPRPHPETNEIQHKRFAQHIGSPRRGAPGRRRHKIYKTGDLARWLPQGVIEFLGRMDHQVKIRGFRIELEEIEERLQAYDNIETAVVVTREKNDNKFLCAYYVPIGKAVKPIELKEYLVRCLPYYMIPVYFVPMEAIPITLNGKVDRRMLPEPEFESSEDYIKPDTQMEKIIAEVWKEVLDLDKIGIKDRFFDIGGNSANILRVHMKLKESVKVDIPLMALFQNPTIYSLASYLSVDAIGADSTQIPDNQQFDEEKTMMKQSLQKLGTNQYRQFPGERPEEK